MKDTLNKTFIILVKYMPAIQVVGILLNNIAAVYGWHFVHALSRYVFGGSINLCLFLLIASYLYDFCAWHKLLILANFINNTIILYNRVYNVSNRTLAIIFITMLVYIFIIAIFTIAHIIKYRHERKTRDNKEITLPSY